MFPRFPGSLALALFVTLSAAAQQPSIAIDPPGPTSTTPFDLLIPATCGVDSATVTRVGNVIKVLVDPASTVICDPPVTIQHRVPMAPLPPGFYRVEAMDVTTDAIYATGQFVVRDAAPPFEVHPFATYGISGFSPSRLLLVDRDPEQQLCSTDNCSDVVLRVDGAIVAPLTYTPSLDAIAFNAPQHAGGLVEVSIQKGDVVRIAPAALYFIDYAQPADLSVFERILFPVLFSADGANGSHWISEAAYWNTKPWFVDNYNTIRDDVVCLGFPCTERYSPGERISFVGQNFTHGAVLLTPRPEAPTISFALRVRDTSRSDEGFGTEIPVVREKDLTTTGNLVLLDVPIDSRFRTRVRIYAFPLLPDEPSVVGQIETIDRLTRQIQTSDLVKIKRTCDPRVCPQTPAYAELDLAAGDANEKVDLRIDLFNEAAMWAFAAVTNNTTQQVTIVTPDGTLDDPCFVCPIP